MKANDDMDDIMKDVPFLEWAIQKEPQNATALFFLAANYYNGTNGAEKDVKKAIELFMRAAEAGSAEAANCIGIAYRDGVEGIIEQDYEVAVKWFLRAAEMGSKEAMHSLYLRYQFGQGVQQSDSEALRWLTKSAETGHAICQRILGECYEYGNLGLPIDKTLAFSWCEKAALQNDGEAACFVGICYLEGDYVEKNLQMAKQWFCVAIQQNYIDAYFEMWKTLFIENTLDSCREGIRYIQQGAELGSSSCQLFLGLMYKDGVVDKDRVVDILSVDTDKARYWLGKAAEQGNKKAANLLLDINNKQTGKENKDKSDIEKYLFLYHDINNPLGEA